MKNNMNLENLKNELKNAYNVRIELHAHTSPVSGCSEISPKEMIDTYIKCGYNAVTITNHFNYMGERFTRDEYIDYYLKDFDEAKEYGEKMGVKVILGAEIRFTENNNDYLIYGVNREILKDIYDLLPYGIENFRKNYKMENSVFLQAHPKRDGMVKVDSKLLDGIEAFNLHAGHNSRVGQAALYAKEENMGIIIAGTDFHHKNQGHEGLSAVLTKEMPEDSFALAKILKSKDYLLEVGRENIILV